MKISKFTHKGNLAAMACFAVVIGAVVVAPDAMAGAGGAEFDDVWTQIKDWTQGTLGRIASGGIVLVGIIGGIIRQSLMPFATGVGGAMGLYNAPTVIEAIMAATLPTQVKAVEVATQLSNGLM